MFACACTKTKEKVATKNIRNRFIKAGIPTAAGDFCKKTKVRCRVAIKP